MKKIIMILTMLFSINIFACEYDDVIHKFTGDGVLWFEYTEAYINRIVWDSLNIKQKRKLFAMIMIYSKEHNEYQAIKILDANTGKKLAEYEAFIREIKIHE